MKYRIKFEYHKNYDSGVNDTFLREFNINKVESDINIMFDSLEELIKHKDYIKKCGRLTLYDDRYIVKYDNFFLENDCFGYIIFVVNEKYEDRKITNYSHIR